MIDLFNPVWVRVRKVVVLTQKLSISAAASAVGKCQTALLLRRVL